MRALVLIGICATTSLDAADTLAGQGDEASEASARGGMPDSIACAQERGEPLGRCAFRSVRDGNGKTTMTVAFANGFKRKLFFEGDRFLRAGMTMSGTGTDFDWSIEDGTHVIKVDGQRYEIPDVLIADD